MSYTMQSPSRRSTLGRSAAAVVGVLTLLGAVVFSAAPASAAAEQKTFVLSGSFDIGTATHIDIPAGSTWTATVDSVTGAITAGAASIPTIHVPASATVPVATDITLSDAAPSTGTWNLATGAITLAAQYNIEIAIPSLPATCNIGPVVAAPSTAKTGGSSLAGTPPAATLTDAGFSVPTVTVDATNCAISTAVDTFLGLPTTATALSLKITQATTDVYLVHGLNLKGQAAADDGGTAVTVCSGTTSLLPDFQFGAVVGPVPLATGEVESVQVYVQTDGPVNCATADPADALINQDVTPTGAAMALVATSPPGDVVDPELAVFPLDVACIKAGQGRLTGAHAAAAPEVVVQVNGASAGSLTYGKSLSASLPAATYSVAVLLDGSPILGPTDVAVADGVLTAVFVVGNLPGEGATPVVAIPLDVDLTVCAVTPPPATPAAPAAAAATFTG